MRFLFVVDPLDRLDLEWDTSLCILRELESRGHNAFTADIPDLWADQKGVHAYASAVRHLKDNQYRLGKRKAFSLKGFDCILIRKDPPVDLDYIHMTHLLELAGRTVPLVNDPRGIRNTNEKLICLQYPEWIPETTVTRSVDEILAFQKKLKDSVILKPTNLKGGDGIVLLKKGAGNVKSLAQKATAGGQKCMVAQRFLSGPKVKGDKRILILGGRILAAFEKRFAKNEFRANLSRGGTFHPTSVTPAEQKLVQDLRPYLLREKLHFVGIDVLAGKLIEVNVTSPAGLAEVTILYPRSSVSAKVADFLECLASSAL